MKWSPNRKNNFLHLILICLTMVSLITLMCHDVHIAFAMFIRPSLAQTTIDTYLQNKNIAPVHGGTDLFPPYVYNLKQSPASHQPDLQAEIALAPDMGSHRYFHDAVFAYTNTMEFDEIVLFVVTLRQSGFDGDVVLSVNLDEMTNATANDEQERQKLAEFLQYHSQQPLGNVVVYNGVIRNDETDETFWYGHDAEKDLVYLRGLYRIKDTKEILEDERIPRSLGVARFELYWVWTQSYSPTSRILLIDAQDSYFQSNGDMGIGSRRACSHGNDTSADAVSTLHIYEENNKGMTHRLDKIENMTMIVEAYKDDVVLKFLYNENVLSPASTHGHQKAVETYLRAMVKQFDNTQCYKYRCEWAFHNYLFYLGVLWSTPEIDKIQLYMQGTGAVNSIGQDIPLNASKIYDPHTRIVYNHRMGHGIFASWCVHQYKEDEQLVQYIDKKKENLVAAIDYSRPLPSKTFDSLHKDPITTRIKPLIGKHRYDKNAIFSIVEAKNLQRLAIFVLTARKSGFEGDIVLHTPKLNTLDSEVASFLKKQAAHNHVVLYEDVMTSDSDDEKWSLDDFYESRSTGQYIPDPRPKRPIDLVAIELFAAWVNHYDASSIIMLIDGERSLFQTNPLSKYWENSCHALELNFHQEHASIAKFGKDEDQDTDVVGAVIGMFTTSDLEAFAGKSLLNPNAIHGHQESVKNYLMDMLNTIEAFKCYQFGCDWAAINYLWYKERFTDINSISFKIRSHLQGFGGIHPLPSFAVLDKKLFSEEHHLYKNWDGKISSVVLGYDQHLSLKEHFNAVAKSLLAET